MRRRAARKDSTGSLAMTHCSAAIPSHDQLCTCIVKIRGSYQNVRDKAVADGVMEGSEVLHAW
jgi:hypothetical protein